MIFITQSVINNNIISSKKAFTLIELILVILLVSLSYLFIFSSKPFSLKKEKERITLDKLKEHLIRTYEFEEKLEFICVDYTFNCYIKSDDKIIEDKIIKNMFVNKPEVYKYNKEEIRIDYEPERIDDVDYDVVFKLKINSDYKNDELILDTLLNKVYVFNSVYEKALIYKSMSEVRESFENKELEVKDAF